MIEEIWKDIEGYEGSYQVSTYGKIKSLDRVRRHFTTQRIIKGKEKIQCENGGYLSVTLTQDSRSKTSLSHRIIAKTFIPNPENKPEVNHKDGNKLNNRVDNLEWATGSENVKHAYDLGLISKIKPLKGWKVYATKVCPMCKVDKPITDFGKRHHKKYNVFLPNTYCKPCSVEYNRNRKRKKKV